MQRAGVELLRLPGAVHGKRDYLTSLKLRKLLLSRRFELVHTHDLHGLMDASICRLLIPGLKHVHTFHFGNYPHKPPRERRIENVLWRLPDALVAVGREQQQAICATYSIPGERLRILWNGVDPPNYAPDERVNDILDGETRHVIGSISTMIEQKGIPDLLEAIRQLRQRRSDFIVLLIGDGHLRTPMERRAAELGLEGHVRFLGWVTEAASRALPRFDIFVQSSRWEAMSMVVLEAMAAARAVVATRVGENQHVIEHERSGLLVPPEDPAALARSLERLLADAELRQRLGDRARIRYMQHFTNSHMVERYQALYEELIAGAG
jgi:glycosyltransferase involved in cell wall biosynthesis